MWAFFSQTKRIEQLVKNPLNALTQASQPPTPLFGPRLLASLMRRSDHLGSVEFLPAGMGFVTCKPFVGNVGALGLFANTAQLLSRLGASGQKGFHEQLIMSGGRAKAITSDHA